MKATPLCTLIIEGVCDCLSSGEGKKWAPPIRPHLGWIAKQELAGAILEGLVGCARSSDASLLEHMQNLSRIFLHYDPTQVWRAACRAAGYSGIHQVNQPFIMNAGVWRAEINFIFRALYFTNKKNVITSRQLLNSIILPQCSFFFSSHVSTNPQPNPDCGHVNSDCQMTQ